MRCVPCGNGNCSISTSMWCSHKLCTDIVAPLSLRYRARPKPLNRSRRVIIAAPRTSKNVKRCRIHGSRGRRRRVCGERETSGCTTEWRALSMKTRLISDAPHFLAPDLISGRPFLPARLARRFCFDFETFLLFGKKKDWGECWKDGRIEKNRCWDESGGSKCYKEIKACIEYV